MDTRYSTGYDGRCTECNEPSEVVIKIGRAGTLEIRLCALCKKELLDRLRPPEPEAKKRKR